MARRRLGTGLAGTLLLSAQPLLAQGSLQITALQNLGATGVSREVGRRLSFVCPAIDRTTATLYGTDTYTEDSPICPAAVHAGALKPGQAGVVSIVIGSGAESFKGSTRNGVTTRSYGRWPYSYSFASDGQAGTVTWRTAWNWNQSPVDFTGPVAVVCPAGGKIDGLIYGTDIYSADSAICVAAVHAGAITAEHGGGVTVTRMAGLHEYAGTERFGIASRRASATRDAFSVGAAAQSTASRRDRTGPMRTAPSLPSTEQDPVITTAVPPPTGDAVPGNQRTINAAGITPGTIVEGPATSATSQTLTAASTEPTGPPPAGFAVASHTPLVARLTWEDGLWRRATVTLFRADQPDVAWVQLGGPGIANRVLDTLPDPRGTYRYRLVAEYEDGTWGEALQSFTPPPLANPTNFRARFTGLDVVTLEWDAMPGAIEYRIDGTGLPNTGKLVSETTTTIQPISGEATWQIAALYAGSFADYVNRPVASTVSRPLPSHAPVWLTKSNGAGTGTETARHYTQLCNPRYRPTSGQSAADFCGRSLGAHLLSWGADEEVAHMGPGALSGRRCVVQGCRADQEVARKAALLGPGALGVSYTNVTELRSHRMTACYFGAAGLNSGLICHTDSESGVTLIVMNAEGARFAAFEWAPPSQRFCEPSDDECNNAYVDSPSWGSHHRLAPTATFDSEGPKTVPHACLACHGGRYDPTTGLVTGASLLPIDPGLVVVDGDRAVAEERIRAINAMIRRTYSSPAVAAYIDGLYGGMQGSQHRVDVPGTQAIADYVPQGWSARRPLYLDFVKKDCAMCHLAAPAHLNFLTEGNLLANKNVVHVAVCTARSMPHAEAPFVRFWSSGSGAVFGPGWFAAALGFSSC